MVAEGGEALRRAGEGGGDAGEELHLHIPGAPRIGGGEEGPPGGLLLEGVEVGDGVLRKGDAGEGGDVEEALRQDEDDVGLLGLGVGGLLGGLQLEEDAVEVVLGVGIGGLHGALAQGAVHAGEQAQTLVALPLALPLGAREEGAGAGHPQEIAQQGEGQGQAAQAAGEPVPAGRGLPLGEEKGQHQQEEGKPDPLPGGRTQLHPGTEKSGDLPGLPGHGQVAGQDGGAVEDLLQVVGDGEEEQGQREHGRRREESPGQK